MDFHEASRMYLKVPEFAIVVDQMVSMIHENIMTPGELREAVVFAATLHDRRTARYGVTLPPPSCLPTAHDAGTTDEEGM